MGINAPRRAIILNSLFRIMAITSFRCNTSTTVTRSLYLNNVASRSVGAIPIEKMPFGAFSNRPIPLYSPVALKSRVIVKKIASSINLAPSILLTLMIFMPVRHMYHPNAITVNSSTINMPFLLTFHLYYHTHCMSAKKC